VRTGGSQRWSLLRRALLYTGLLLALLATLFFVAIRCGVIERYFIYLPERDLVADPAQVGLSFEEVYFVASDGVRLHGWFVPGRQDLIWLWFHGNAGNISHRLDNLKLLHDELGVSVFLFDYRGYGRSQGRPSEEGTYRDAEAALAYLRSRGDVDAKRIVYFGRSLGAGVAVELAAREPPLALILESPFPSIPALARHLYPFLPIGALLRTKYDSLEKIDKVKAPLLVLHGDRDEIVPLQAGRSLFEAAREPKQFHAIRGAGHNDTYLVGGAEYLQVLRRFLDSLGR
jgi:hypothetical protein